jgi:hypothetical protein
MSTTMIHLKRRLGVIALAGALAALAIPAVSQASEVDIATADPFVVLGGTRVTNTGPSVLNGDLGVSPGTELSGFGPAVLNGVEHENDAVAAQAQLDVTNAYNVAAGQPVLPANDLSETDLGERTLHPGAYKFTSTAQLTGVLTLDADGNPNAQFVFEIGSGLTTAPASSVILINGASPCNVFWQVGSSATIDTTTAFVGNLMALTSITFNTNASLVGRALARNGQVSLDTNTVTRPLCSTESPPERREPPPTGIPPVETTESPGGTGTPGQTAPGSGSGTAVSPGRSAPGQHPRVTRVRQNGTAIARPTPRGACTEGFRATVSGKRIERVVFSLDGTRMANLTSGPYAMSVKAAPGRHTVRVRVTFNDATRAKTMTMRYRACAAASLRPHRGPSQFTG